ncbi:hypothetical protein ATANTOWER_026725 [Ataeniobius toweri]|uniref:Uncharacterized protein n=1 Tax=Ataeniobius toweri TaxID=208326 RepID=A0ABU7A4D1_9TELE|nr:hypothetical protein [Ataeniobius toweri]
MSLNGKHMEGHYTRLIGGLPHPWHQQINELHNSTRCHHRMAVREHAHTFLTLRLSSTHSYRKHASTHSIHQHTFMFLTKCSIITTPHVNESRYIWFTGIKVYYIATNIHQPIKIIEFKGSKDFHGHWCI